MSTATPAPPVSRFPTDDSLCETCGYSLRGLAGSEKCPECGTPLAESDPARRVGLPWQNKMSMGSWVKTTWMMVWRPRQVFRILRIGHAGDKEDQHAAAFLLIFAVLAGLLAVVLCLIVRNEWGVGRRQIPRQTVPFQIACLTIVGSAVVLLSRLEAIGVTLVAKRRQWRVSYRTARQVTSYAAVAWISVVAINVVVLMVHNDWFVWNPFPTHWVSRVFLVAIFAISILWFETLVWLGVRQVRYANFAEPPGADLTR